MSFARYGVLTLFVAVACVFIRTAVSSPPDQKQIAKWIEQLGDDDFQRREAASQRLWEAGEAAEEALQSAAKSPDAEVSRRAQDILERFKWGIYPDTSKKTVELINRYRREDGGSNRAVIEELFANGSAGCRAVLKIARAEKDEGIRRRLFQQISNEMSRAVPPLLTEDNFATLALLVDTALDQDDVRSAVNNYTAFWTLRGKLDERIALFQARTQKNANDRKAWEVLAYLHRAKGNGNAARAAALKANRNDLVDALLQEAGAWKELAARPTGTETTHDAERFGFRAAYCRLAGDQKGFEEAVEQLRKLGNATQDDEGTALLVSKALFLNDRPADALECLKRSKGRAMAFEVLVTCSRFQEALKLVDEERKDGAHKDTGRKDGVGKAGHEELPELEILAARTLWSLGEKDKARPVFARYAERIKPDAEETWFETLVESELRVGLKEEALIHAARIMTLSKDQSGERRLLPKLYPNKNEAAEVWWEYLRQQAPARDPGEVLKQVDDIVRGKLTGQQTKELVKGAGAALKALKPRSEIVEQWTLAIAEAALAADEEGLAKMTLENSGSSKALQKLGDLYAEKKQWEAAASRYCQAWEAERQRPLPLFLWGRALAKAGQDKEGQRRMDQAHWLPLGNEEARHEFAVELAKRGLGAASRREDELLLRVSQPASYYAGEARRRLALEAQTNRDFVRSAEGQERAMLRCLRTYVSFVQPQAYVAVPGMIHRQKARGLLAAGKVEAALKEADLCLIDVPGDVDVPILLGPALEKDGHSREASDLFGRVNATLEAIVKDYPKCAWAHNSLAWLSACCRRELDAGVMHARRAVELEPDVAGFHDTFAEVHFQKGNKVQAIEQEKQAVKLDPKKPYYGKQLKRMEAGDPSAVRPAEDEDDEE